MIVHVQALAGILIISFAAILVRLAEVSAVTATLFRCLYAIPLLLGFWYARRASDRRSRRHHILALGAGVALFLDLSLWHEAIFRLGAGLGTILVNTQVVFVAFAAWLLHGERPGRLAFVTIPVMLAGVTLVSGLGRPDAYGADPVGGTVLGVMAGGAYAAYLVAFRAANPVGTPTVGPLAEATAGALLATALIGPAVDPRFTWSPPAMAHVWLATLGVVAQVGGWVLIGSALPRLPALETSVMMLAQPVGTMLWGFLLFSESVSWPQLMGVVLVLGGVAVFTAGSRSGRLQSRSR